MLPTNTILAVANFIVNLPEQLDRGDAQGQDLIWWISRYWGTVSLEFTGGKNVDLLEILNYTLES